MYLLALFGNTVIFSLVCLDPYLHTPMYFLANLSILDICCPTVALHKIIIAFISGDNTISLTGCVVQVLMFLSLTCDELLLLTAMSYDRYVAICIPLHYHQIMNCKVCGVLATLCWACGFLEGIPTLMELLKLKCLISNKINHFFCDIVPLMKLSCDNTSVLQLYILTVGSFVSGFLPFALTFSSYVFIISTILRIQSSAGRRKAFYTCSSHLTVVTLLYTSLVLQYLRPNSMVNLSSAKFYSLFNTAAVPMLNPLIYSLKNKDVKAALMRRKYHSDK
ncbi:olfactory receptor 5V1-like [Mantella aurantiaca]